MKNLFQLLLLTCVTSTLFAADGSAEAAAESASKIDAMPTYESELAASHADLGRSVSPDSRPYVGTVRRLELDAKYKHDIAAAEAVAAIYNTLPSAARSLVKARLNGDLEFKDNADIEISGTDLAKKLLLANHLARTVTPLVGSSKDCLAPSARRSLLTYLAPKEPTETGYVAQLEALKTGLQRWCPKPAVVAAAAPHVSARSNSHEHEPAFCCTGSRA